MRKRDEDLLSEVVVYKGYRYHRYPNAKDERRRKYYWLQANRKRGALHRHIYEDNHGPIPEGWEIHHKDGDWNNNSPDNLVAMDPVEHRSHHGYTRPQRKRSDGTKGRIGEASRKNWEDPEFRANQVAKRKAQWADPVVRERMLAARRRASA